MMKQCFMRFMIMSAMIGAITLSAHAGFIEGEGVRSVEAIPSPDLAVSNLNDYINQEDNMTITPTDGVVKILRTDQKNNIYNYVTEVIPLRFVNPREIRNVMRYVVGMDGGRVESIRDKNTKEDFLQVIAPSVLMPYIRAAITELDVPWLKHNWSGNDTVYLKMKHRDARTVDIVAEAYASSTEESVEFDDLSNAIIRSDEEMRNKSFVEAVNFLDIPANQVLLDVKIYEIAANNDSKIGLDFLNWKNTLGRYLFMFSEAGGSARYTGQGEYSFSMDYRDVAYNISSEFFDFLQSKGKAKVINSQQILVHSAQEAVISADQQILAIVNNANEIDSMDNVNPGQIVYGPNGIPFWDTNHNGEWDDGDTTFTPRTTNRSVNYRNAGTAGISMRVFPMIGLESMQLDIELTLNDMNGLAPNGTPIINSRGISTSVRLLDGQPYVIAGLKQSNDVRSSNRTPYLGAVPGFGWLFGAETNLNRESEVVIVITPSFQLATMAKINQPQKMETMKQIVEDGALLTVPDAPLGYDMWLLGRASD